MRITLDIDDIKLIKFDNLKNKLSFDEYKNMIIDEILDEKIVNSILDQLGVSKSDFKIDKFEELSDEDNERVNNCVMTLKRSINSRDQEALKTSFINYMDRYDDFYELMHYIIEKLKREVPEFDDIKMELARIYKDAVKKSDEKKLKKSRNFSRIDKVLTKYINFLG